VDPSLKIIMEQLNKMSAGQEEISTRQDKIESDIISIRAGQTEFEENMTDTLDKTAEGCCNSG
jgi:hypothetical protein